MLQSLYMLKIEDGLVVGATTSTERRVLPGGPKKTFSVILQMQGNDQTTGTHA